MKDVGDWAGLHVDLLDAITKHLDSYGDYVRLRAVCMQWKSALPKKPRHQHLCQLPWLIIQYDDETLCSFFSLLEKKVYHLELPEAGGKLFRGSSFGWLVTVEGGPALQLLNPFTRAQIDLPPISTFPNIEEYRADRRGQEYALVLPQGHIDYRDKYYIQEHFIRKVILSSSPTSSNHDDYMAVAICGLSFNDLAFCRRGDQNWTAISTSEHWYIDIIFHEEKLYALTDKNELVVFDMGSTPKWAKISVKPPPHSPENKGYLVAAGGELLMIERCWATKGYNSPMPTCGYKTTSFNTYKLDLSKRRPRWSKLESLGDQVLLLGYNSSLSVSPHNFPNCKGDCIYYTDDMVHLHDTSTIGGYDIGVFNLENKTTKRLAGYKRDTNLFWPSPVWVLPYLS